MSKNFCNFAADLGAKASRTYVYKDSNGENKIAMMNK